MNRNYDENPLVLQDDFYRIAAGCAFLLGINLSMIFLIFFSGIVDWQSGPLWEVFRAEAMRDGRFVSMFIADIFMNILAAADLIKKLKNPSLVYLYEDKIFQTKKGVTINFGRYRPNAKIALSNFRSDTKETAFRGSDPVYVSIGRIYFLCADFYRKMRA